MTSNPRYANGARRRTLRARILREEHDCGICGEPVDKDLPHLDPLAAEIDEIIPVAHGGNPLDRTNCRLAHRICNQCRGTGEHHGFCIACQRAGAKLIDYDHTDYDELGDDHAPAGQHCDQCNGVHHPERGVAFITARTW